MRNTDNNGALAWIEPGRRFTFEDIVFWRGKEHQSFLRAAGKIDTIATPLALSTMPPLLRTCGFMTWAPIAAATKCTF